MKQKLHISKDELISQLGEEKAMELITQVESVKFSKKEVKKIEDRLNSEGSVTIRRLKTSPKKFEFVSKEYVHLTRQYTFQKPEVLAKIRAKGIKPEIPAT